ncbi:MAG TPA: tetratricopeptide repeat protein [Polyangia bacterium]|jgi:Flp pilus assembly protein TadD/predicted Zn-dependent protease with MMP-like domain
MQRAAVLACLAVATAGGCRSRTGGAGEKAPAPVHSTLAVSQTATPGPARTCSGPPSDANEPPPRPLRRCFADRPAWLDAPVASLLDRAAELFDDADYSGALACAEEAARQAPRSVEAHHNRAISLMRLDRLDEARDAIALALALAPDDPETLEAAADLNINQLAPSVDRSALGLEYARRGSHHVGRRDRERAARLALLEGQALIDLGRAVEALKRIDGALKMSPRFDAAIYERGVALFELCRFGEARKTFEKVLAATPDHAHALYHLGLIEERLGEDAAAGRHLAAASAADVKSFPVPLEMVQTDFAAHVQRAVSDLPEDVRHDLGGIKVEAADLPDIADLVAEKPPLSPTILGLFRGLPLDYTDRVIPTPSGRAGKGRSQPVGSGGATESLAHALAPAMASADLQCDAGERTIVLYRRNLLRTVHDVGELDQAISRTLLHEVGHLRGEDDGSLRDRGLE